MLARLDHPSVVRIHAVHEAGERIALSLELVLGRTLDRLVEDGRPLPPQEAVRVVLDLCAALGALHEQGIVHRDVKPANVMRAEDGRAVLLDFGVARIAGEGPLGPVAGSFGTLAFAAPEVRATAGAGDARSDVFSLGVLLHWLVTGALPGEAALARAPRGLLAIAKRAAALRAADRLADTAQVARALRSWVHRTRTVGSGAKGFVAGVACSVLGATLWWVWSDQLLFPWEVRAKAQQARAAQAGPDDNLYDWLRYPFDEYVADEAGSGVPTPANLAFVVPYDPSAFLANQRVHQVGRGESIQTVIQAARDDDVIAIGPGTYRERLDVGSKRLTLVSTDGPAATILDGSDYDDSILTVGIPDDSAANGSVTIAGLSFTGGLGKSEAKEEPRGGALMILGGDVVVRHCLFFRNGLRGAMFGGAIAVHRDTTSLYDCALFGNTAWACGGAILADGAATIEVERCTIVGNLSSDFFGCQGGIGLGNVSKAFVRTSVLWGNAGEQIAPYGQFGKFADFNVDEYSLVQGRDLQQPGFVDAQRGDFRRRLQKPLHVDISGAFAGVPR